MTQAEPIQWCEVHRSVVGVGEFGVDEYCTLAIYSMVLGDCSIVPKLLVSTEGETHET